MYMTYQLHRAHNLESVTIAFYKLQNRVSISHPRQPHVRMGIAFLFTANSNDVPPQAQILLIERVVYILSNTFSHTFPFPCSCMVTAELTEFHCDTITRLIHPINFNYFDKFLRQPYTLYAAIVRCWSINPESDQLMNRRPTSD